MRKTEREEEPEEKERERISLIFNIIRPPQIQPVANLAGNSVVVLLFRVC